MANEIVICDPSEVATGRTELALHPSTGKGAIMVRPEGPDWGDADIAAYMAEGQLGDIPVDFRQVNRIVTVPLLLQEHGATSFDEAREQLQQKIGLFQREGGWLKREMRDGRKLYLDVVKASLKMGGGGGQAQHDVDGEVTVVFETIPDWYEDEETLDLITETTEAEIAAVLKQGAVQAVIKGDHPGRCRIVVNELDGDDQLGLLGAFRSRHYSAAATAALEYEAEALDPLDTAAIATVSGASGGATNNVVEHANLATSWTPVLSTNLLAGTYLTHTGTYRVWARIRSTDGDAVKARFVWDVGDLTLPEENARWTFPPAAGPGADAQFYLADLGEIRLDKVPVGSHRWRGQIQAKGDAGGEDIQVDKVWFQPLDETAWRLTAPWPSVEGRADQHGRDALTGASVVLNASSDELGNTWTSTGDAPDFTRGAAGASRSTSLGEGTGRSAVLPGALTGTRVAASVSTDAASSDKAYLIARSVDGNNRILAGTSGLDLAVEYYIGGVLQDFWGAGGLTTAGPLDLVLEVAVTGVFRFVAMRNGEVLATIIGQSDVFATGGALASGQVGIHDRHQDADAVTRTWTDFSASPLPPRDAVIIASQSAELRTDGMFREDSTGAAYGPVSHVVGDLPRIPPSGMEGRAVEFFLKASRGDFDQLPDSGIDDISAQVFYRPSWMFAPSPA